MHDPGEESTEGLGSGTHRDFEWVLIGPHGLRAGWSILLFAATYYLLRFAAGIAFYAVGLLDGTNEYAPTSLLAGELSALLALAGATALMARFEGRRFLSYNLIGPRRAVHFLSGAIAGFVALSVLVATMAWGEWLRFPAVPSTGTRILVFAAEWGCAFLVVGLFEEGFFRCYALVALTRGISFWWALAAEIAICSYLALRGGQGTGGVYAAAALGFFPCLALHQKAAARSAFWQAAWVTSTLFGFYHTSNPGESGVGILAAAFIGFVFCVSIRITGSAWWAIGCHAAWDWAETFFYGTADSGLTPRGSYLTTTPAGKPLWSGGAVGPEGSVLVLGAIVLLLALLLVYGRLNSPAEAATE